MHIWKAEWTDAASMDLFPSPPIFLAFRRW